MVLTPVAPVAGEGFFGASGGSGTKPTFSTRPPLLFHLRSNWVTSHETRSGLVVKMLCSTCPAADGLVQFDEPKTAID